MEWECSLLYLSVWWSKCLLNITGLLYRFGGKVSFLMILLKVLFTPIIWSFSLLPSSWPNNFVLLKLHSYIIFLFCLMISESSNSPNLPFFPDIQYPQLIALLVKLSTEIFIWINKIFFSFFLFFSLFSFFLSSF